MEEGSSRKLAVIVHADVVGSTALVRLNETVAEQRIQDAFRRFSEMLVRYGGVAHEIRGDALVAEFSKASDAVSASISFQEANTAHNHSLPDEIRPALRIGIAMGEVVISNSRMTGEGVVLAQRLEQLAEPGGVCIQDAAYQTVPKRLPFVYESLGEQELKGFDEPIKVYTVRQESQTGGVSVGNTAAYTAKEDVPQKRTLVVLPFTTIGKDPEIEDLADGMAEVVINTLERTGQSDIVDRASALAYKGRTPKPAEIAEELGVKHVLQGSIQKSGSRVRITAELFDAESGAHLWSERFDRHFEDPFQLQDDIAKRITQAVRTVIVWGVNWEVETEDFDAWLLNIQAVEHYTKGSAEDNRQSRRLCEEVTKLDPTYAYGPCNIAWTHWFDCVYAWSQSPEDSLAKALEFSNRTFEVDQADTFPHKHGQRGLIHALRGEYHEAIALAEKTMTLLPDDFSALEEAGQILLRAGEIARATDAFERSIRLVANTVWIPYECTGVCCLVKQDHERALSLFARASVYASDPSFAHALTAATLAELGQMENARAQIVSTLSHRPGLTLQHFHYYLSFRDPDVRERLSQALLQAGLPR